jgi:hypothetical protein
VRGRGGGGGGRTTDQGWLGKISRLYLKNKAKRVMGMAQMVKLLEAVSSNLSKAKKKKKRKTKVDHICS